MNIEEHATPHLLVPVVSDNKSYDDYIGDPQVSEGETLVNYGTPMRPLPPEPHHQQSAEGSP